LEEKGDLKDQILTFIKDHNQLSVNRYRHNLIDENYFEGIVSQKCGGALVEKLALYGDANSIKNQNNLTRTDNQYEFPPVSSKELSVTCDMSFSGFKSHAKEIFENEKISP
jgi:hypothetical protein